MTFDSSSFWGEIKKYEDTLAGDPDSYCFAPLAEVYRKIGLLDEAMYVAKRGVERHPDYVGGLLALGRVYFEKGFYDEGRTMLEKVVTFNPDNLLAQKLLSTMYLENGDNAAAERSLQIILSLNPADSESRATLAKLPSPPNEEVTGEGTISSEKAIKDSADFEFTVEETEDEDIFAGRGDGDIEELTEIIEDHEFIAPVAGDADIAETTTAGSVKDPFTTVTLAELYESQGFINKALLIYQELLEDDPDNESIRNCLLRVKNSMALQSAANASDSFSESALPVSAVHDDEIVADSSSDDVSLLVANTIAEITADCSNVFEKWLETIRRMRVCRSEKS